jgi:hypothetical protein
MLLSRIVAKPVVFLQTLTGTGRKGQKKMLHIFAGYAEIVSVIFSLKMQINAKCNWALPVLCRNRICLLVYRLVGYVKKRIEVDLVLGYILD